MTPTIPTSDAAICYPAGTIGSPVQSISHATTNCVVPPQIVTPSAYRTERPLDRTAFGNASGRKAYTAPSGVEKTKLTSMFSDTTSHGDAPGDVMKRYVE